MRQAMVEDCGNARVAEDRLVWAAGCGVALEGRKRVAAKQRADLRQARRKLLGDRGSPFFGGLARGRFTPAFEAQSQIYLALEGSERGVQRSPHVIGEPLLGQVRRAEMPREERRSKLCDYCRQCFA